MRYKHWLALGTFALASVLGKPFASAQLAPVGDHYGGKASDTGFSNSVNSAGAYAASVPLDLPAARGGIPVPVQINYTGHGVGAAGVGWDVPLSFIRREMTFAHRRPLGRPGVAPAVRGLLSVVLDGRRIDLVQDSATTWAARRDASDISVRQQGDTWLLYDGRGLTYTFSAASSAFAGTGIWHLASITGPGGNNVKLTYTVGNPGVPGAPDALSIDLAKVEYNNDTTGCFKNSITLAYDNNPFPGLLSIGMLGTKTVARAHPLTSVVVGAQTTCGTNQVLRTYQLVYAQDTDTRLARLQQVQLKGRPGTPEATTPILVGSYTYGAATTNSALVYGSERTATSSASANIGVTQYEAPNASHSLGQFTTTQGLVDVTGDGRPDLVFGGGFTRNKATPTGDVAFDPFVGLPPGFTLGVSASNGRRYDELNEIHDSYTLRQAIDVNGDGRIDVIDATEVAGAWTVYLNTPDPTDAAKVAYQKRSYATAGLLSRLRAAGLWEGDDKLPLASRSTASDKSFRVCVKWNGQAWVEFEDEGAGGNCPIGGQLDPRSVLPEKTITQWELRDVNGDGYPDFVFNSSNVALIGTLAAPARPTQPNPPTRITHRDVNLDFTAHGANQILAELNVMGVLSRLGGDTPYSSEVILRNNAACGFSEWVGTANERQQLACGLTDVNGDGLVDLVENTSVSLGTGGRGAGAFFTAPVITLPGAVAVQSNRQHSACASPATGTTTFTVTQFAGLRDLTGDGIPDYAVLDDTGHWSVQIGTGVGFTGPVPVAGTFGLSSEVEDCAGARSTTTAGLFDMNGDGLPDPVTKGNPGGISYGQLLGSSGAVAVDSGRLTRINNGFGAVTTIHYLSAKDIVTTMTGTTPTTHQLPFPEIVVDKVSTTGTLGLGGDTAETTYAYARGEQVYDPALDIFSFRGYRRTVQLQVPTTDASGVAIVTDMYGPASTTDPFGVGQPGATVDSDRLQRYKTYLVTGRVKDVTVLSGVARGGEIALLGDTNIIGNAKRIATTHYEWDLHSLAKSSDPAGPEVCNEMVFPYDFDASHTYAVRNSDWDLCAAHGFAFGSSVQSSRTQPGALLSSTDVVTTRSEIRSVDDFGRVLLEAQLNDLGRSDDDFCVATTYATPTGSQERVLSARSTQDVTKCNAIVLSHESWLYDGLASGAVSSGFPTSHLVDRRTDAGNLDTTVREYDATYDIFGNVKTVSSRREDGALRTMTLSYDAFSLVPTSMVTTASGVATQTVTVGREPATLAINSVTDPNGTVRETSFDGFDRPTATMITTPDGISGQMTATAYVGFGMAETGGRKVVETTYVDPSAPHELAPAPSHSRSTYLDELGRPMRTEVPLGEDYGNEVLVVGRRLYDSLGRVSFTADPFPTSQAFATAYGTNQFYNTDGTPSCAVRAKGKLGTVVAATDETNEIYPTCFSRVFRENTEVITVQDSSSLLGGSPQAGVKKVTASSAIGRVLSRSTVGPSGARLEYSTFSYDTLGHMSSMTRFQDAAGGATPVTWTWKTDSLGQLRQLVEADGVPLERSYSDWGEVLSESRTIDTGGASIMRATNVTNPDDPPPPPVTLDVMSIVKRYDALGRIVHSEERRNGVSDSSTVRDYLYDVGIDAAPQVRPTNMTGRLAQAISATGAVSFSYDGYGDVNAKVFTDGLGRTYVEKHTTHGDGSPSALDLLLPDTAYSDEHVTYQPDSAGRVRTVQYANGSESRQLASTTVDVFGRVRTATHGAATFAAAYDDVGRRLIKEMSVTSSSGSRAITFNGFDPAQRERSRNEARNGTAAVTTSFAYDALGRLASAVQSGGANPFNATFSYDPLGNLTSNGTGATATTMTYVATDADRICRISYGTDTGTGCNVGYDRYGNVIQQATRTGTRTLSYFNDGNVRTIDDSTSHATFRYDAFGALQELDMTSSTAFGGRQDRHYGDLITVRREDGQSTITRTIPLPNGSTATRHGSAGSWVFAFGEQRGGRFFVDEQGAFVQEVDYTPFGEPRSIGAQPGSKLYTTEQWNGGDSIAALGLSHLGARMYDPVIGRFLSRDPLLISRTSATTNPYAFAMNDPVNDADPSGLEPQREKPEESQSEPKQAPPSFAKAGALSWPLSIGLWSHSYRPHYNGSGLGHDASKPIPVSPVLAASLATTVAIATSGEVLTGASEGIVESAAEGAALGGGEAVAGALGPLGLLVVLDLELGPPRDVDGVQEYQASQSRADFLAKRREEIARSTMRGLAERRVHLFRGITRGEDTYDEATLGRVFPRGGHSSPLEHNRGDTYSVFTSWTARWDVAERYALESGAGVVLDYWFERGRLVSSPDEENEQEWLVLGPVVGANVTFVPRTFQEW